MLKIAVIGCGIAGPAAGLFLKKLNAEITVFDKVSNLKPIGAGFLLQPAGLHALSQIGLADALIAKGAPISGLQGKNHKGRLVLDLHYSDLVPYHMGLGMHRAVLYEELSKKMSEQQIPIINPCHIIEIKNHKDYVLLKDDSNQEYGPFDCVIIADGTRSKLRDSIQSKIKVSPYEWGALWTICSDKNNQFNTILEQVYRHTDIMAGVLPMGYDNTHLLISFFWSLHQSQFKQWQNSPFEQWKDNVLSIWPKLTPLFHDLKSHDQFALASYSDIKMYPWHDNRVVVIGDAAHGMSPQLGQGANLALLDAQELYNCLNQYPVKEALETYSLNRKTQLNFYQKASRFVTPWFQSSHWSMGILRDLFHGTFCKTPILKQQMLLTLACMKTGYFTSTSLNEFYSLNLTHLEGNTLKIYEKPPGRGKRNF